MTETNQTLALTCLVALLICGIVHEISSAKERKHQRGLEIERTKLNVANAQQGTAREVRLGEEATADIATAQAEAQQALYLQMRLATRHAYGRGFAEGVLANLHAHESEDENAGEAGVETALHSNTERAGDGDTEELKFGFQ